jgi:parallel beta-helix repeat protein
LSGNAIMHSSNRYAGYGIFLVSSDNNTLSSNTASANSGDGFFLVSSSGNVLSGNTATSNIGDGIELVGSSDNVLSGNTVRSSIDNGISVASSSGNVLSGNSVAATTRGYGIGLVYSSGNNTVSGNTVTSNNYGIELLSSSGNRVFHNNFLRNGKHVYNYDSTGAWDNGYPSGGNFWSDYTGVDLKSGSYQNETGSDGIGDTPYVIDAYNNDRYRLTKPYGGPHDIGIVACNVSKTVIGRGYVESFRWEVINYGVYNEIVFTGIFLNQSSIAGLVLDTMHSRSSVNLGFSVSTSTTMFTYGSYTVTAYAYPVLGETDTTDNTRSISVKVTIPGDISGDFKVDDADLNALGRNWGLVGSQILNPNADINCDDKVACADLNALGLNWGLST